MNNKFLLNSSNNINQLMAMHSQGSASLSGQANLAIQQARLTMGNNLPLSGQTKTADQAIAEFQQLSGMPLTGNSQAGRINFPVGGGQQIFGNFGFGGGCNGYSQKDINFIKGVNVASMILPALGGLLGGLSAGSVGQSQGIQGVQTQGTNFLEGSNISNENPLAKLFEQFSEQAKLPNETGKIIDVAEEGMPFVNNGVSGSLDNAISLLEEDGKVTDAIKDQYKSGKQMERTIDTQIDKLSSDVKSLSKQKKELAKLEDESTEMMNKELNTEQQDKLHEFNKAVSTHADAKNLAEKYKADYEMMPDKIMNDKGEMIDNPHKEEVKKEWQEYEKQAEKFQKEREKLKKEIESDPKLKKCALNFEKLLDFAGEYEIKKARIDNYKTYKKTLSEKTDKLGELVKSDTE